MKETIVNDPYAGLVEELEALGFVVETTGSEGHCGPSCHTPRIYGRMPNGRELNFQHCQVRWGWYMDILPMTSEGKEDQFSRRLITPDRKDLADVFLRIMAADRLKESE